MKNLIHSVICVFFAILMLVFVTESTFAQDATKADSVHYKVEFENDQVRVLRITYGPGEKSVMHEHPNAVAIDINAGHFKMTLPDGKTEEIIAKAGQAMWTPAGKHLPENIGDKPAEVILVEIKAKPTAKSLTVSALAQDATKVDPAHYKVEFENDQVRVLRITYGPGEKSVMHGHPEGLAVFLTDHHIKCTYPDGKTEELTAKAGQTNWAPAGKHLPENISDKPLELILVEMKVKPAMTKKN
jgi:quercetin dioxygenase-like cupin family protein